MTARKSYEEILEQKHITRMHRDDKTADRMEKREDFAASQIGELCREGRTVYYVYPVGGKYREGSRADLIAFLIRNSYA